MGRTRVYKKDEKLPPYVSRVATRNRITIKTYFGQAKFGKTQYLRDQSGRPLCANATTQEIFEAYKHVALVEDVTSLQWLFAEYFKTAKYDKLAGATRKKYRMYSEFISATQTKSGKRFGEVDIRHISKQVIARYRDKWESERPVAVAREMQFMSAVFSWAVERGHMDSNPAKGVSRPTSKARDRYVSQEEIEAVRQEAGASPYLAIFMELAYLCRARVSEILELRVDGDVKKRVPGIVSEGIYLKRSKGSESEITLWTPRLRSAVEAARGHHVNVSSQYLLHDRHGGAITYSALRSAFVRALDRSGVDKFTLHDLKAAGISDHEDHAGGHRSARMRDVYVRTPSKTKATV